MGTCIVCQTGNGIYKCPECRQLYCSVKCCKIHKQSKCTENIQQQTVETIADNKNQQYNYTTEDTVPLDALQKLRESKELKDLLRIPDLQKLLIALDQSKTHNKDVQKALLDRNFSKFVDTCFRIVDCNQDRDIPEDIVKLRDQLKEME